MKKCPLCGQQLEEGTMCPSCGILLIDMDTNQAVTPESGKKKIRKKKQEKEEKAEKEADTANTEWDTEPLFTPETSKKSESSRESSRTFTVSPILVIMAAVIVVLIAVLIFVIVRMGSGSDPEPVAQPDRLSVAGMEAQEDSSTQDEVDLSAVDINAYEESYVTVTGEVVEESGTLLFVFDTPHNIYLYDDYEDTGVVEMSVSRTMVSADSVIDLNAYVGRGMTLDCSLAKDDGTIMLTALNVVSAEPAQDNTGIHQYKVVVEDCTWEQARQRSADQGGYLLRISSAEEYNYIVDMLNSGSYKTTHFYLGGRRDASGTEYYWVDEENNFMGDCLNQGGSWTGSYWYPDEPSFYDTGSDASGSIDEDVMNLFCVSGTWYLNDSASDLAGLYPSLLSGKVGYIIEFE